MSNDLVKKEESTALASWGQDSSGIDASDVLIPSLLLMQGLSELVGDKKAAEGDLVKSTTKEVVGGVDKPVLFIPLTTYKTWRISQKVGGKYEFRGITPYHEKDRNLPWDYEQDGTPWRRDKVINFYVLLVSDMERELSATKKFQETGEMPSAEDALFPCLLSFARTSYNAGRQLITHFAMADKFKVPAAMTTFKLTTQYVKDDKGRYYVFELASAGKTKQEYLGLAKQWHEALTKSGGGASAPEGAEKSEEVPF